jgi:hypothetical protein
MHLLTRLYLTEYVIFEYLGWILDKAHEAKEAPEEPTLSEAQKPGVINKKGPKKLPT